MMSETTINIRAMLDSQKRMWLDANDVYNVLGQKLDIESLREFLLEKMQNEALTNQHE